MFIREVYGRYLPTFQDQLRHFIRIKDKHLMTAIEGFEKNGRELPADIRMPSTHDNVSARFEKARTLGLRALRGAERKSVVGKLRRTAKDPG